MTYINSAFNKSTLVLNLPPNRIYYTIHEYSQTNLLALLSSTPTTLTFQSVFLKKDIYKPWEFKQFASPEYNITAEITKKGIFHNKNKITIGVLVEIYRL